MIKLKRAVVVANPHKPWAGRLAGEVARFLTARGAAVARAAGDADALIIIGGDGTLLYNKSRYDLPMFGIGSPRSAICQAHRGNWRRKLSRILALGFRLDRRMMLTCEVGGRKVQDALNEIVVRSRDHRVIDIHLVLDGRKFNFYADGVLFSTPTGSSSYAYSCGGRELPRHARRFEVVAIAPYRRRFKPAVVSENATASVTTRSSTADLVFDGQFIHRVRPGQRIRVYRSARQALLVRA